MRNGIVVVVRVAVLTLCMFFVASLTVAAVEPNVRSVSGALVPVVDGNEADWQTTPTDASNPDWFAFLCTPSHNSCATPTGDLFMRYDCATNTLYLLVVTRPGNTYTPDPSGASTFKNYVTFFGVAGNLLQDGPPYTTNPSPNMWRDLIDGRGYEAAYNKVGPNNSGPPLTPGTYNVSSDVIANINGTSSGHEDSSLVLRCQPTAVSVSSISAQTIDGSATWASLVLGAAGLVALGSLVVIVFRRR